MAIVFADRVKETWVGTGTGTITLAGAATGYQSFAAIGDGNTCYYCIVHQTLSEWEVGVGTYTASGTTLARTSVRASSNAGSAVNFSAGTKVVASVVDATTVASFLNVLVGDSGSGGTKGLVPAPAAGDAAAGKFLAADGTWKTPTLPQNSKSAAYTTVLADAGGHIFHPSADTTARTWTIDSNANVAYPIGTTLTFVNQHSGGVITIAITSDTMRLAGLGTTGSRTLAADGVATALKLTSTEWIISGTGLT